MRVANPTGKGGTCGREVTLGSPGSAWRQNPDPRWLGTRGGGMALQGLDLNLQSLACIGRLDAAIRQCTRDPRYALY